jgi:hypothetical protein
MSGMKRLTALVVVLGLAAGEAWPAESAIAAGGDVKGMEATYSSGTTPGVRPGVEGRLDTTSVTALEFHSSSGDFSVPYAGITAAKYREENRFPLGVLPAIGVDLMKARSKRHWITFVWKDDRGVVQVAILENSRENSIALLTIVRVRAPQICSIKGDCIGSTPN